MRFSSLPLVFALSLGFACSVLAPQDGHQRDDSPQPTVDQILDRFVQALGGKAAIEKQTSSVSRSSFEYQGKSGTVEVYAKAPNKFAIFMEVPGVGQMGEGFDGSGGWIENPQTGMREKTGQELSVARRGAEFYGALRLRELYPKMTLRGGQLVGNRPAYLIEADPGDGSLRRMYFDAETGLLARNDIEYDTPQGRQTFNWFFEDYREVDGVKVPFTRRQSNFTYKVTEVLHDVPIDNAKFAKPSVRAHVSLAPANQAQPNVVNTESATQATITSCKSGTGVRLYKHFLSVRAYKRLDCGSTVEVLNYSPGQWARVRQGIFEGYIEPWHIHFTGSSAEAHPVLNTFLQAIAQGMQAYGNTAMDPRQRLAQNCLATAGCSLEASTGQQWTPITQPQQVQTFPDSTAFRLSSGGNVYNAFVIKSPTQAPYNTLPAQNSPALVLKGDSLSFAIINGYGYVLGADGQWHPTGLGPGQPQGVEGMKP